MENGASSILYLIEKRFELTTNKLKEIQQYIVSLLERILHVIGNMNIRLNYLMELSENPQRNNPQSK
jgi:hypothetical protein